MQDDVALEIQIEEAILRRVQDRIISTRARYNRLSPFNCLTPDITTAILMKALDELAKIHPAIGGRHTTRTRLKTSLNAIFHFSGRSRVQSCVWHVEDQ